MDKVKVGLIGAGWIARQHLNVIKDIEWIEPCGIASRTKAKVKVVADEYNIPLYFDNIEKMVSEAKPDALMVLVSEDNTKQVVSSVIPFGLPLFIEKPAGLSCQENEDMMKQAKEKNIATMVGFNRRFYSIFHKGLEIIRKHGKLLGVFVEGHERMWRIHEGGKYSQRVFDNWVFANSTHTIDLLRFFAGDVNGVSSIAHSLTEKNGDQFAAIMETSSGAIGQYSAHWYSPGGWKVVLYGEGVTVEFKPLEKGVWIDKKFEAHPIEPDPIDLEYKPGFYRQMEAFGRMVLEKKLVWPGIDLEGSLNTMFLASSIAKYSG